MGTWAPVVHVVVVDFEVGGSGNCEILLATVIASQDDLVASHHDPLTVPDANAGGHSIFGYVPFDDNISGSIREDPGGWRRSDGKAAHHDILKPGQADQATPIPRDSQTSSIHDGSLARIGSKSNRLTR